MANNLDSERVRLEAEALARNGDRKPKFGDSMRNPWAGETNPQRDGYFVKSKCQPSGRVNPGLWYEMTDGQGKFWDINGKVALFREASAGAEPASALGILQDGPAPSMSMFATMGDYKQAKAGHANRAEGWREAFEARGRLIGLQLTRHDDLPDVYSHPPTQLAWEFWKARGQQQAGVPDGWVSVDAEQKPAGRTPILVAVWFVRYGNHEDGTPGEYEGVEVTEGEYVPAHGEMAGYFASYQGTHGDASHVTHWMPLPAVPSTTKTGSQS